LASDEPQHLVCIGLVGDGDEVDAIVGVEKHFGISLDYADAPKWVTAGDVFASLLSALPSEQRQRDDVWPQFASIMCDETGADPLQLAPETLLLGPAPPGPFGKWLKRVFSRST
jgi:hypothetical protein